MAAARRLVVAALSLVACGGKGGALSPVGLPQLTHFSGPVLAKVELVTITYADDPLRATDEAFGDFVVASDWISAAGKDYGVGPGTHRAKIELPQSAPAQIADYQIDGSLTQWIAQGTVPPPDGETLYLVYFPATTTVTDAANDAVSCTIAAGYHSEDQTHSPPFPYAVVPTCPSIDAATAAAEVQGAASHEIMEAATDPYPISEGTWQLVPTNPWAVALQGVEVGDLCFPLSELDQGFTLSRIWSNSAAAAGDDPCLPDQTSPYHTVYASPSMPTVQAGGQSEVTLVGWSKGALSPWPIAVGVGPGLSTGASFTPTASLSTPTIGVGQTAALTIQAPQDAPRGATATLLILSEPQGFGTGLSGYEALYAMLVTVL